jgi:hypothetical protein
VLNEKLDYDTWELRPRNRFYLSRDLEKLTTPTRQCT